MTLFRIAPAMPPNAYQTYRIWSPKDLTVRAACEQVGCQSWQNGWQTTIDESTELGRQQGRYIRRESGRTFTEQRTGLGLTVFRFEAKQRCFADHKTRPEQYTRVRGDWRGTFGESRVHRSAADWVEDFGEHQQRLADEIRKG